MIKKKTLLIIGIVTSSIILISLLGYFGWKYLKNNSKDKEVENATQSGQVLTLEEDMLDNHMSKSDGGCDYGSWRREVFVYWNDIEETEGVYDWSFADQLIIDSQTDEVYTIFTIMPYANWDQDSCHGSEYEVEFDPEKGGDLKVGKPCDMAEYKRFLADLVERYDGDGEEDMDGLKIPVKYWEIMNEPNMQGGSTGGMGEELKFFVGTPQEYLDILIASYETIKATDPTAKLVQGGMAGMQEQFLEFWEYVFENGGGNYMDIANIHAISVDERTMDLFVRDFKAFINSYDVDLPIFITEAQFGSLTDLPEDLDEFKELMVKSSVFSLASGGDKIFYITNWRHWGEEINISKEEKEKEEFDKKEKIEEVLSEEGESVQEVYENIARRLGNFDTVTILDEEVRSNHEDEGYTAISGQYKFTSEDGDIYVVWGEGNELDGSITGTLEVTDIHGNAEIINSKDFEMTDIPVYIEIIQ